MKQKITSKNFRVPPGKKGEPQQVADVIDRVPQLGPRAAYVKQAIRDKLIEHKQSIGDHGADLPAIRNWKWKEK